MARGNVSPLDNVNCVMKTVILSQDELIVKNLIFRKSNALDEIAIHGFKFFGK